MPSQLPASFSRRRQHSLNRTLSPEDAHAPLWFRVEGRSLRGLRISFGELPAVVAEEEERPV
jgi:hypothetical protein